MPNKATPDGESDVVSFLRHVYPALEQQISTYLTPHKVRMEKDKKGEYPFISLRLEDFFWGMTLARRLSNIIRGRDPESSLHWEESWPKFLDVGCGIGTKLRAAKWMGFDAYGLEITEKYVEFARAMYYSNHEAKKYIIHADGREFKNYRKFDVIYFYCPMCQGELQKQLERAIYSRAKSNTIFVGFLKKRNGSELPKNVHELAGCVLVKTTDKELLQKLRDETATYKSFTQRHW